MINYNDVELYLVESVKDKFFDDEIFNISRWQNYAQQIIDLINAELTKQNVFCYDGSQAVLNTTFGAFMNHELVQNANEKTDKGYSQIETSYQDAIHRIESGSFNNLCNDTKPHVHSVDSLIKFGKMNKITIGI
jgi:hypothetical protein